MSAMAGLQTLITAGWILFAISAGHDSNLLAKYSMQKCVLQLCNFPYQTQKVKKFSKANI